MTFAQGLLILIIMELFLTSQTTGVEAEMLLCYTRDALLSIRLAGMFFPADLPKAMKVPLAKGREAEEGEYGSVSDEEETDHCGPV